jgi:PTH1 family peptidyl-tRNA hydrolase
MVFIVGLGNPGPEYIQTRHNAGWLLLDKVAAAFEAPSFSFQKKFQAEVSKVGGLVFIKPQTYMNNSGQAVRSVLDFYNQPITQPGLKDLIVFHDDLDLELGSYKLQLGTGPKVHNGLGSVYQHLGSQDFWHLRIGVDNRAGDRSMPGSSYVLKTLTADELKLMLDQVPAIIRQLEPIIGQSRSHS